MKRFKLIGLTGQSGAGKSTVSRVFAEKGAHIIDADAIVAQLYNAQSPCLKTVAACFGADILREDGTLDRRLLASRAFADAESTALLGRLVHPFVTARLFELLRGAEGVVVFDAPQLYEAGADIICDAVIAVVADKGRRMARIIARDGITEEQAESRLQAQLSERFFRENADMSGSSSPSIASVLSSVDSSASCTSSSTASPQPASVPLADTIAGSFPAIKVKTKRKVMIFAAVFVTSGYHERVKKRVQNSQYPQSYSEYVEKSAKEFDLEPALVYAVIRTESSFNVNAQSPAGAHGLMQITEDTFEHYMNILRNHLDTFGDEECAVAAYNAGPGNVEAWLTDPAISSDGKTLIVKNIPFEETRSYVQRVESAKEKYLELYYQ